jgi:hypothetical protein
MLVSKTVIAVKQETTQGSAVSPAATDFLLAEDVKVKPTVEMSARNPGRTYLGTVGPVAGKRSYEVTFKTELKGSGTPGTPYTPLGAAIQACGFTETATGGVSVVYAPTNSAASANFYGPGKSVTIEVYLDGVKHVIAGCIGTCKLSPEAGKVCMREFSFKGVYADPSDTSPGTQTYLSTLPPIVQSASFSMHSLSAIIAKFDIDFGSDVSERPDVSSAVGIKGFLITGKKPAGSVDPELVSIATHAFFTRLIAGTEGTVSIQIGTVAGNIITFQATKAQYVGLDYGERSNLRTIPVSFQFNEDGSTNWCTITFT